MMEEIGGGGKLGGEVCVSRSVDEVLKGMMNWLGFVMKLFLQILRGTPSMAQFLLSYIGFTFPLLSSSSSSSSPSFKPLPVVEIPLQETTSKKITDTARDSSCPPGYVCDSGASDDCLIEKLTVVLDLDETLICAYETSSLPAIIRTQAVEAGVKCFELECFSSEKDVEGKPRINYVTVFERPGLKEFLKQIGEFADLILFTAGLEGYARPLFDRIDVENRFSQRLYRPSTVSTPGSHVGNCC
ncbi:NUCLEAR LIM INTERACTOR-INTERACTING FACTOR-RELATED [Salix viminalis]|uniref:Mitochondrial import inner membrane translocase subunit TIM50 n=1 Tax=Salix viminalis TaxID=40686 RepID=A0A9Q0ZPT5_SALVM|nr:NUCLEAR LIM INTERACTOR-INTERACTING FACTOR-RELATED [Salix viminalis]